MYSIAYANFNIFPIYYTDFPIMTFNLSKNDDIPSKKEILIDDFNACVELESPPPFIHMFEKMHGENYKTIYQKIMGE